MRLEKDSLGQMELPDDSYYGIQTQRSLGNFDVTMHTFNEFPQVVRAMAEVKKACALANRDAGMSGCGGLPADKADAICRACDEIMEGRFAGQFPVNIFRGCGTSINMNVNEVIANRANELLTGHKGFDAVHPNTHVNMSQSSNDVFPTVEHIVLFRETGLLVDALQLLEEAVAAKEKEFSDVVRLGRTALQDAVPMTMGQLFSGYASALRRCRRRLQDFRGEFATGMLGATAIGTGMGMQPGYFDAVYPHLSSIVGFEMRPEENFFDGMQNVDSAIVLSALVKAAGGIMGKIANDLRLLSSGPRAGFMEMSLPATQPGSSIMPGKINPFVPDLVTQVMQQAALNDWAATLSFFNGEPDIAASGVLHFMGLVESCMILRKAAPIFAERCIAGIRVNREKCRRDAEYSTSLATLISSIYGYDTGTKVAHAAYSAGISCKEATLRDGLIPEEEAEQLFDVDTLTDLRGMENMLRRLQKGKE